MRRSALFASAAFALAALPAAPARAEEPVTSREPRLLRETGENTTVIDALDDDDPFDATLSATFRQQWKSANVRRESYLQQSGYATGGFTPATANVASYSQSVTTLELGADIGIWKDLALSLRLPFILADRRALEAPDGSTADPERLGDGSGQELFAVPMRSPTRSGVDWIGVGLSYAILNQQRDDTKPTWVIGAEGRFAVGSRIRACNDGAPVKCPDPINPALSRDPGISRGMNTYVVQTVFSRRLGYVEPYAGFRFLAETPQGNTDFARSSATRGTIRSAPPMIGTMTVGVEVFPWERRETFSRLGLDFKLRGSYHSAGRDYSELFDALGSSQAGSLRAPNPARYQAGPAPNTSVADPNGPKVYFDGITDQTAFGSFGASSGVTWQAGEYVKFTAGLGLTYAQSHLVTAADACHPDFKGDPGASGPCRSSAASPGSPVVTGIPNPNHRPAIDLPGRRFSVDDTTIVDLWLSGVVMF